MNSLPFLESITVRDFSTIAFLVFLEGILSIDNAVVLALLAKGLPPRLQKRALTYGLAGAFFFRFVALFFVTYLMQMRWVKFVGGGYLILVALKHFLFGEAKNDDAANASSPQNFWKVVIAIELTDVAFAVDSILAAVAVTQKLWVVFTGGVLGIVMMRFAASIFLKILKRFPGFETTAYLLVLTIGVKLFLQGFHLPQLHFEDSHSPAFWIFWGTMAACLAYGFVPARRNRKTEKIIRDEARVADDLSVPDFLEDSGQNSSGKHNPS
jgi:YkoY family integral membrane protein